MSQLIFTVAYHTNHTKLVGNLLEYMGKREGVEKLNHPSELLSYMGERPMVEKLGEHGLFSATDEPIHLYSQKKRSMNTRQYLHRCSFSQEGGCRPTVLQFRFYLDSDHSSTNGECSEADETVRR